MVAMGTVSRIDARPAARGRVSLLPDVSLVAAGVTLFYCLFLFQGYQKLFRDSDAGWHIRNGETILQTGTLPRQDPYSFTKAGQPWFAWEWGADVVVGAIHRSAGLSGVALFYAAAIAAGVWLWFRLHWACGGNFLLACGMAPLLLSTCNIHWLARPHVLSWLFLLAAAIYAERPHARFGARDFAVVACFTALWANVHASFFLAPAMALAYAVGNWTRAFLWNGERSAAQWYWRAAAVSAVAALANPYGWGLYGHVFRYLTDSELLSRIGEFQAFNFQATGAEQIVLTVAIGIAGGVLALARRRPEHFLLAMGISAMAMRSARMLPICALLLLPFANAAITASLACAEGLSRRVRWGVDAFLAYSERLRALDARGSGLVWAPLLLAASYALLQTPGIRAATGFAPDQFPVAAYSQIPENAHLFAPDKFGGYLIYRSAGAQKVFFDGRSDLYGAEFLKQYSRLMQARPGWQAYWDRFHFTHALLPADSALGAALQARGWRVVYQDRAATLLEGNGT